MNARKPALVSEVMILPDGRIFAHNLTRAMARLLSELNPHEPALRQRAAPAVSRRSTAAEKPSPGAEKG